MKLDKLPLFHKGHINVIVETPRGCRNKFDYDPELHLFRLKKTLPMGMSFPFDFGFVPNTIAPDGDPLDVLIIMDEPAYPGCLVECRILGAINAIQTEVNGKREHNDRIIAISISSVLYAGIKNINDLNKKMVDQVEHFFMLYNEEENKNFKPISWVDADAAKKLIRKSRLVK